uniref:Zinc finger HIT domain-containing protein 2 n=1 Tax=Anthurium amnicola TaxID=1678845 RepID=A0A1D1XGW2_9ARAE
MENRVPSSEAILVPSSASGSPSFPATRIICRVCQKQFSQYTCPRCNTRYCSLQCYQKHGLHCTESFMRENVMEEMSQMQPDTETKRRMLEILNRMHLEGEASNDEDDDRDEDSVLSEETVQKILSGTDVSLKDLSPKKLKQFHRAIASGELSKMIVPWEPWWLKLSARRILLRQDGTRLVRPVDEQGPGTSSPQQMIVVNCSEVPPGPEIPLPALSKLSNRVASTLLAVHFLDVLYSYCFTLRLYNGDWHCDPFGAAMVVLSMSSVLGEGGQPETVAEALSNCLERTCSPMYRHAGGVEFGRGLLDDIITLLSLGMHALICLLCDLQRLILAAESMLLSEKMKKVKRAEMRSKLRHAERKVYFLMCWVHEQPGEVWSPLASLVQVEKASLASVDQGHKSVNGEAKGQPKCKLLIEEV